MHIRSDQFSIFVPQHFLLSKQLQHVIQMSALAMLSVCVCVCVCDFHADMFACLFVCLFVWVVEFEAVHSAVTRPAVEPGQLWTDHDFSCSVALPSVCSIVLWQRPHVRYINVILTQRCRSALTSDMQTPRTKDKNSSGDEIANVNVFTTITHTYFKFQNTKEENLLR